MPVPFRVATCLFVFKGSFIPRNTAYKGLQEDDGDFLSLML